MADEQYHLRRIERDMPDRVDQLAVIHGQSYLSLAMACDNQPYPLADAIHLHWLEDGEHSLKPRKASGRTEMQNWQEAVAILLNFVASESSGPRFRSGGS